MKKMLFIVIVVLLGGLCACETAGPAATAEKPAKPMPARPQFLIKLTLTPHYQVEANWKEADNAAVGAHLKRFYELKDQGKLILAGRTQTDLATTFGLVVVEVENEAEARSIMENDPAVKAGIMKAELFPYQVAVGRCQ